MQKVSIRRRKRPTKPLPDPNAPRSGKFQVEAPELLREYMTKEINPRDLKVAAVWALVAHFVLFFIVIPTARVEPIPMRDTMATTIVKRYKPPAPPSRPKKNIKKKTNPIPIPDPTPDEPEPIFEEDSEVDFGDPDAEFLVGLPNAPPGPGGARAGAVQMGSGGLMAPILMQRVLPEYTPSATRAGVQGDVYIEAVVTVEGTVVDPRLIRGLPDEELNARALDAILQWSFKPGIKDGRPVPVIALFTVTYRIH